MLFRSFFSFWVPFDEIAHVDRAGPDAVPRGNKLFNDFFAAPNAILYLFTLTAPLRIVKAQRLAANQ